MKKRILSIAKIFTLVLLQLLVLCACGQRTGQASAEEETTAIQKESESNRLSEETEAADIVENEENEENTMSQLPDGTQEGEESLTQLRKTISTDPVIFGAAYLGYVGGLFENGFEQDFPAWLKENNPRVLEAYPFIADIDKEHILGGAGHLYCIVPIDESATLAVNRIRWNETTKTLDNTEVLYRSESGEPVLFFANLDGVAYEADTQVIITDRDGMPCAWYPSLDANSRLVLCAEEGECYSRDFTDYGEEEYYVTPDISVWLEEGWLGPTELSLCGEDGKGGITWSIVGTPWDTDRKAIFMMTFYPGDETGGRLDLDWLYTGEEYKEQEYEEQWSGFWKMETKEDQPSCISIDLTLVGGKNYETADGSMYTSDDYRLLLDPSGEHLMISSGRHNGCLPFMTNRMTTWVLEQAKG